MAVVQSKAQTQQGMIVMMLAVNIIGRGGDKPNSINFGVDKHVPTNHSTQFRSNYSDRTRPHHKR